MELILSFGIVGTIIITTFFVMYYKRVFVCRNAQSKYYFSSIAVALTAAIAAHGLIDLTFMWVQTGLLYCLLMGGIGVEERLLKISH
jgi:O-antigen/teichoic acid export membrane protein